MFGITLSKNTAQISLRMSFKMRFAVAIVCLIVANINAEVLPCGKCEDRNFTVADISIEQFTSVESWNWLYVTDAPTWSSIDRITCRYSQNNSNEYNVNAEIVSDSTLVSFNCGFSEGGGYFINRCFDEIGNIVTIRYYVLYFVEGKILYAYRCLESKGAYIDEEIRFLAVSNLHFLTDEEKQIIFELDSLNFEGELRKLAW